ncbi:MAG: hypothetical protein ABJC10_02650 [Acidobacteriota bacterium]
MVASGVDAGGKTYTFTVMRRGTVIRVVFAENRQPDVSPSELKSPAWALISKGHRKLLRIKVFGKNYNANKYESSFAYFEPCEPGNEDRDE